MSKPSIPQGTRDFSPETLRKRRYILDSIQSTFELYGFQPLETPAIEKLETLMGKYGDEGDKLIYKIRSNKNLFRTYPDAEPQIKQLLKAATDIDYTFLPQNSDKALRYDLTIPFARYVAMNYKTMAFPFKRYQTQTVWRGDKPQRGRYREFTQCDADVVGSNSLINEVDLVTIYASVFSNLGLEVEIKINNRKILQGIAEYCGCKDKLIEITNAIDKIDKIGRENVRKELIDKDISEERIDRIFDCIFPEASEDDLFTEWELINEYGYTEAEARNQVRLQDSFYSASVTVLDCLLRTFKGENEDQPTISTISEIGMLGVQELISIFSILEGLNIKINVVFNPTLARGLNYYTGAIFEVAAKNVKMGSIGGGGRYDDLTGLFGVPGIPGVGISFGVDRIYDVLEELNLFPPDLQLATKALFFNLGATESLAAMQQAQELRNNGIACEVFHEPAKMDKQFKYAEKKLIPYAIIIGSKEIDNQEAVVKTLATGQQENIPFIRLAGFFKNINA